MRDFPEGFHADRLLQRVLAPPALATEPPPLACTPLNPKRFRAPGRPALEHRSEASPMLLVRQKAGS